MKIGILNTNHKTKEESFNSFCNKLSNSNCYPDVLFLTEISAADKKEKGDSINIGRVPYTIVATDYYLKDKNNEASEKNEKIIMLVNSTSPFTKNIVAAKLGQAGSRIFGINSLRLEIIHWSNHYNNDFSGTKQNIAYHCDKIHHLGPNILLGDFNLDINEAKDTEEGKLVAHIIDTYKQKGYKIYGDSTKGFFTMAGNNGKKYVDYCFSNIPVGISYSPNLITDHKYMEITVN